MSKNVLLKCDPDLVTRIDLRAARDGKTRCGWIKWAIELALDTDKPLIPPVPTEMVQPPIVHVKPKERVLNKRVDRLQHALPPPSVPVHPPVISGVDRSGYDKDKWADIRAAVPLASEIEKRREKEKDKARDSFTAPSGPEGEG